MDWTRGPVIGRGSSAAVSLAITATGDLLAVKSADISYSTSLQNEQRLISQLCSPYIIKCFGSDITPEKDNSVCNIFLEYVAGGTLSDLIGNQGGSLDENAIKFYTQQVLEGLNYLHIMGIVHCDIKGQNLLLGEDGLALKIADFGCAKRNDSGSSAFAGTPAYMAPEVARCEEQSFASDIWALGCTVVEMATGSNPWPETKNPASALYRVAYSDDVPEIPRWFSDVGKDFLDKCLKRDWKERWTAAELLRHPFLTSADCGEIRKATKKSPTSVMDQHFWDDVEVPDFSPDTMESPSSWDSPVERMRGLIWEGVSSSNLDFPAEDEDWVTVRDSGAEEMNHDYEGLINDDCFTVSCIGEEEIETSIIVEDSFFHSFRDVISMKHITAFQYILDDSDVDDPVSKSVNFPKNGNQGFLLFRLQINNTSLSLSLSDSSQLIFRVRKFLFSFELIL